MLSCKEFVDTTNLFLFSFERFNDSTAKICPDTTIPEKSQPNCVQISILPEFRTAIITSLCFKTNLVFCVSVVSIEFPFLSYIFKPFCVATNISSPINSEYMSATSTSRIELNEDIFATILFDVFSI